MEQLCYPNHTRDKGAMRGLGCSFQKLPNYILNPTNSTLNQAPRPTMTSCLTCSLPRGQQKSFRALDGFHSSEAASLDVCSLHSSLEIAAKGAVDENALRVAADR